MKSIKIAIFEDNKSMREGLKMVVESYDDLELCFVFSEAEKSLKKLADNIPDVVLMDIQMPGISGIEATAIIREKYRDTFVLIQTVFEENDKIFAALCAGASGYIVKNSSPDKIYKAILEVAEGGTYFTPVIAQKVLANFSVQHKKAEYIDLSPREKEILQLLVDGMSYKMVAANCGITYETVHTHIKKIYEKLHVNSKSEAVGKALKQRLV